MNTFTVRHAGNAEEFYGEIVRHLGGMPSAVTIVPEAEAIVNEIGEVVIWREAWIECLKHRPHAPPARIFVCRLTEHQAEPTVFRYVWQQAMETIDRAPHGTRWVVDAEEQEGKAVVLLWQN